MGVIRRRTELKLASPSTSQILSVSTAELLYTIQTGSVAVEFSNLSTITCYYGMSNLSLNSGGILSGLGSKMFDSITGNFFLYFRATSAGVTVPVIALEFGGADA